MRWEVIAADNDTLLLIIMILIDFFLKQDVLVEKGRSLFRFIVDVALNAFLLRITNFEVQRIYIKKEVSIVFLMLALLTKVSKAMDK